MLDAIEVAITEMYEKAITALKSPTPAKTGEQQVQKDSQELLILRITVLFGVLSRQIVGANTDGVLWTRK